jgi:hypothetical protein
MTANMTENMTADLTTHETTHKPADKTADNTADKQKYESRYKFCLITLLLFRTKRSRDHNVVLVKRTFDLGCWEFGMGGG